MAKRRKFSAELKREAGGLVRPSDQPANQVARDLDINANVLTRWYLELGAVGAKAFQGQGKPRDEELAALRRELAQVKKERDFLHEAVALFANRRNEIPHDRALPRSLS